MLQPPKTVVWLSGMPRSGTTWLSQIFASSLDVRLKFCPLFSYEFKNLLDETSSAEDWMKLFHDVYHRKSEYLDQDYLRKKGLVPDFPLKQSVPSHLVIKSTRFHNLIPGLLDMHDTLRVVHLVRDPRGAIHSWLSNPYEFPVDADPQAEWRTGACRSIGPGEFWGFDAWKHVNLQALRLQERYHKRFRIWSYENLMADPACCVGEMFDFCDLKVCKQTVQFLQESQSKHVSNKRSVFKKPANVASWKGKLDAAIVEACTREVAGTPLAQFLRD